MEKDLEYYISCFSNLRRITRNREKSPHKIIVLLSVIQAINNRLVTSNLIVPDAAFENIFFEEWHRHVGVSANFDDSLFPGFYNLRNEDFWHLISWSGDRQVEQCIDIDSLRKVYQGAVIDEELYSLLNIKDACLKLENTLISQLHKTNTISHSFIGIDDYLLSLTNDKKSPNKDLKYYKNAILAIADKGKDRKNVLKLIMLLSTAEYIQWHSRNFETSEHIALVAIWEGMFINNARKYLTETGRESTLFSAPFIQLDDEPFWHLQPLEADYKMTGYAIKTFDNLQNIYDGVCIDKELLELMKVPATCEELKHFIIKLIPKRKSR